MYFKSKLLKINVRKKRVIFNDREGWFNASRTAALTHTIIDNIQLLIMFLYKKTHVAKTKHGFIKIILRNV